MDSPKCSWVLCSVHILAVFSHPTLFPFGRTALFHRIRYFLPVPFFTQSLVVYLTLLPLTHLLLDRTLAHDCVVYVPPSSQSFAPPLRSLVKFVLYHHGFCSYVAYSYQYNWLNSFIPFLLVNLNS